MFKLDAEPSTWQESDWYSDCGESDNGGDDFTPSHNLYHGCEWEEVVGEEEGLHGDWYDNEYEDDAEDHVCSQGDCGQGRCPYMGCDQGNSFQGRFRILRERIK
jgi:hypothetical protein